MSKMCLLEDKTCSNCGECNFCDLDHAKICDNCCACLGDAEYTGVYIDDILFNIEDITKEKHNK